MNFPGFSSVQSSNSINPEWNSNANTKLSSSEDPATFVEVALGLIDAPAPAAAPAVNTSLVNSNVAAATIATAPAAAAVASPAPAPASAATNIAASAATTAPISAAAATPASAATSAPVSAATTTSGTPVVLTQAQTDSIFSDVLTPAQYLNNVMARIQAGSPVPGNTPLTVSQTLQLALNESYSTPENPYAECSDPNAAAALVAQIAGPNASLIVPTVATMSQPPSAPAGWVGNYTVGYTTQSSGFNDSAETFSS